jgi:chemosensory pili system protein ChpA (sensor histidine kinase/response regulator)
MSGERRDYVALEWVAGEISETLAQSATALNDYLQNRDDITRLRFCLTYVHQVYGTLKMVEFAGAALLAEEMEEVVQALLSRKIGDSQLEDALQALKMALAQLPGYLQQLLAQRRDAPALLLPIINDLRAVRGETLITESAVFVPELSGAGLASAAAPSMASGELLAVARKLRQMYQIALLNYLRNIEPRENLNYLAKVCARLSKLAAGTPSEALWKICIALCEGLLNRSIQPSAAVKNLLRQVDSQLKVLAEQGSSALALEPPAGLIKNLLYYIAASGANSRYISEIKQAYNLGQALPEAAAFADDEVALSIKAALAHQLLDLADDLARGHAPTPLIAAVKRAQDTTALLGMSSAQVSLRDLAQQLRLGSVDTEREVAALRQLADSLELAQRPSAGRPLFNDSEEAQEQLDKAFDAVMRESRSSLEQAKEAIIEFVATQWRHSCLEEVPALLSGVRGSFAVAGLHRASDVLAACESFVRHELLEQRKIPAWQLLDTLADAIASVDYYLERLSEDAEAECESILSVAEQSVATLALTPEHEFASSPALVSAQVLPFQRPDAERAAGELIDDNTPLHDDEVDATAVDNFAHDEFEMLPDIVEPAPASVAHADGRDSDDDDDAADPEIIEIFIEEAGEVLATINEHFAAWAEAPNNHDMLAIIRRAFHTLKGSGRMVGAIDIGELAWSVENMLNRVMDGSLAIDRVRVDVVGAATALVPAMAEAFSHNRPADLVAAKVICDSALALAREQKPTLAVLGTAAASAEEPEFDTSAASIDMAELAIVEDEAEFSLDADGDDSDNTLLDIFAAEALTHLQTVEDFILRSTQLAGPAELSDDLQRALHTLKGSAHMAGVQAIAELVTPVEHLIKELRTAQIRADADIMAVLTQAVILFRVGLGQSDPHATVPGTEEFVDRVNVIYHTRLEQNEEEQSGSEDSISPAAFSYFLADAVELISAVSDDLRLWEQRHLDDERQHTLAATISQVADNAELLNLAPVVELAQALQALLRQGADTAVDERFFELANTGADTLIDMLDRLAANQQPDSPATLVNILQEFEFGGPAVAAELDIPVLDDIVSVGPTLNEATADDTWTDSESEPEIPAAALAAEPGAASDLVKEPELIEEEWLIAANELDDHGEFDSAAAEIIEFSSGDGGETIVEFGEISAAETHVKPAVEATAPADLQAAEIELEALVDAAADEVHFELVENTNDNDGWQETPVAIDASGFDLPVEEQSAEEELSEVDGLLAEEPSEQEPVAEESAAIADSEPMFAEPLLAPHSAEFAHNYATQDAEDDEIDLEILEIFLEEAGDLLEAIDEAVHGWSDDRANPIYLDDLQRLLHTLKGGARLAGLKNLGNLSHNFETLLINAQQQNRAVDEALLGEVHSYQDQLVRLVDAVKVDGHSADFALSTPATALETPAAGESTDIPHDAALSSMIAELLPSEDRPALAPNETRVVPFMRPQADATPALFQAPTPRAIVPRETEDLPEAAGIAQQMRRGPQEVVKISAQLLEQLVNLAGETSISRSRSEEQVNEFVFSLDEMQITVDRLHEQVRRLDLETEAQMLFRQEQVESEGMEGFDPLEFDRYSLLQQLSRSLLESASDLVDIKSTLSDKARDMETLLVQQSRINSELQEGLMRSRMVPFARMVPRLRRIVRQVAGELDKQVDFFVDNAEGELDRTVLERVVAPLEHMLRNAIDHGIEAANARVAIGKAAQGTVVLSLGREGGEIVLTLADDGRGIDLEAVRAKAIDRGLMVLGANLSDHEVMQFILQSGFSTAKHVTQISGRGVGMDVVYSEIKQLGGTLEIDSAWGQGTRFIVRLPFTVSVNRALMVSVAGDIYAIPLNSIEGIVRVSPFELEAYYQPEAPLFEYAGQPYLMRYMGALLRTGDKPNLEGLTMPLPVLLVRGSDHAVAVQVDGLMGSREIVVKTLGPQFSLVQGLSGATVLGDGSVVVILDLMAMIRADASQLHRDLLLGQDELMPERSRPLLVMVVDDSVTVRKVTSRFLERQGMEVMLAKDGVDAINLLQESEQIPDVMLLDIEMPRMDGFEVASRLRHTSRWQNIPIIMITSRTGDKHRERAFSLGVNRYLGKPYQEMALLDTIHELTGSMAQV